jgi:hypothetical protein
VSKSLAGFRFAVAAFLVGLGIFVVAGVAGAATALPPTGVSCGLVSNSSGLHVTVAATASDTGDVVHYSAAVSPAYTFVTQTSSAFTFTPPVDGSYTVHCYAVDVGDGTHATGTSTQTAGTAASARYAADPSSGGSSSLLGDITGWIISYGVPLVGGVMAVGLIVVLFIWFARKSVWLSR